MKQENSLAIMTRVDRMLAQASTVQEAKEVKDLALTAADWAKRKGLGVEAIRKARAYATRAKIKMGELLKATEPQRAKGGQPYQKSTGSVTLPVEPTLTDLGISKRESSEAQALAKLPKREQQAIITGKKTETQALREAKRIERQAAPFPKTTYTVLYADPPWSYSDKCDVGAIQSGGAEKHYPAMSMKELRDLPVQELAAKDAILFLWVTAPMLPEGIELQKAWGFTYKTCFVWDKVKHNMGHYSSVRHELLFVCVRGSCTPQVATLFDSVQSIERTPKHSEKPERFREIIDTLYPKGRRIELFARTQAAGWDVWGNEP